MSTRIGVDVGGTFTDLIFFNEKSKEILIAKVPTTPTSPEKGCMEAISNTVSVEMMTDSRFFLHGTTVGLNALIERKGAKVGLLCTRNFRDILEIKRGDRAEMYNLFWQPPEPIVPRYLRLPVTGRIMADGKEQIPFSVKDILDALEVFKEHEVSSIAIAFMNSYANSEHELAAECALRDAGFDGGISLSHRVSGEYHEYERTSTTVIDAFVQGRMENYLQRLESKLFKNGFSGTCMITRSGGGAMLFSESKQRSFETIMSGPVAGAEGAGEIARKLNIDKLITADVGGTSFDTCLITGGRPKLLFEGNIVGMPLQTPWVDVRSIGSGGGSIAHIDSGGLLRVGPQSAGAVPGPACYGKGGKEACLTDAALCLGMLGEGKFASGLELDRQASEKALEPIASELNFSIDETACGILKIACAAMANTINEITLEDGLDPRQMPLMAFGGAGPLMATLIAEELDIDQIIIPPYAGNFSAWGLLGADLVCSLSRTRILSLSNESIAETNKNLKALFDELAESMTSGDYIEGHSLEIGLEMRYVGQEHALTIKPANANGQITGDENAVGAEFKVLYKDTFGAVMDEPMEIVSLRATVRQILPGRDLETTQAASDGNASDLSVNAYSFTSKKRISFKVITRDSFSPGDTCKGPVIINESTTTSYIDAGYSGTNDNFGNMIITRDGHNDGN